MASASPFHAHFPQPNSTVWVTHVASPATITQAGTWTYRSGSLFCFGEKPRLPRNCHVGRASEGLQVPYIPMLCRFSGFFSPAEKKSRDVPVRPGARAGGASMASLFKRKGSSNWQIRYYANARKSSSPPTPDRRKAEKARVQMAAKLEDGTYQKPSETPWPRSSGLPRFTTAPRPALTRPTPARRTRPWYRGCGSSPSGWTRRIQSFVPSKRSPPRSSASSWSKSATPTR